MPGAMATHPQQLGFHGRVDCIKDQPIRAECAGGHGSAVHVRLHANGGGVDQDVAAHVARRDGLQICYLCFCF